MLQVSIRIVSEISPLSTCRIGKQVIAIVQTWKSADEELAMRTVIIESTWTRSKRQVDFLQRIAQVIDDDLFLNLDNMLNQLYQCLCVAMSKIESLQKKEQSPRFSLTRLSARGKATYIWKKKTLDAIIVDLEAWRERFDPSWFLIMKIASPVIDKELRETDIAAQTNDASMSGPPNVAEDPLAAARSLRAVLSPSPSQLKSLTLPESPMQVVSIDHCDAHFGRLSGASKWYLIDSISTARAADISALKRNVRQLAVKLSQADPMAFGLLSCKGVMPVRHRDPRYGHVQDAVAAFQMIFRVPQGMDVLRSLRTMLLKSPHGMSVTQRVRLACQLATSISYVHTFGFVHKNIRPESILCFENKLEKRSHTFLVGFDSFRAADGATNYHGDMEWEQNLYRHPMRQGPYPADKYRMAHDIYSLGVCLLEIGLWEPLVVYDADGNGHSSHPVPGPWYTRFQNWLATQDQMLSHQMPWKVKDFLVEMAGDELPPRMGDKYTFIVLGCLSCLDKEAGADQAGQTYAHEAGMSVAVQFVEETLVSLTEILT